MFGEKTVDSIISKFEAVIDELEKLAERKAARKLENHDEIVKLTTENVEHDAHILRASKIASNLRKILV